MDIISKAHIIKYHNDLILKYGINTIEALGWSNKNDQLARFNSLLNIQDLNNHSVLDVGCGTGDFLELINRSNVNCDYTGIDHIKDFIELTSEKYKTQHNACFLLGDFSKADLGCYDYIIASGTFNYKNSNPHFIYLTIAHFFSLSKISFSFNLLDNIEIPDGYLMTYNKNEILEFCKKLSPNVILKDDYLNGEYTVIMWKR
jgi:SAM-dependent methyltransferase